MRCAKARRWVSGELDGTLGPRRSARLARHLASCGTCRELREDFAALVRTARELRAPEPPPGAWDRIRTSLAALRAGTAEAEGGRRATAPPVVRAFWPRTVATAAAALLLVAGGVVLGLLLARRSPAPSPVDREFAALDKLDQAERYYQLAIASLAEAYAAGKEALGPAVLEVFERNMEAIDASIQACRLAVSGDPDNLRARDYLLAAYREKMQFLDTVLEFQKSAALPPAGAL